MYYRSRLLAPLAVLAALTLVGCAVEAEEPTSRKPSTTQSDAAPAKRDVVKHKLVRIKKRIPYSRDIVKTSALDKGVTVLDQEGRAGVQVRVFRLTIKNGVEVRRDVVKALVARQPVGQVRLVGTRVKPKPKPEPASNCDSNYTGACVPIASDVDCGGGSGDGPEYVDGPVQVVGSDVYDLDNDGDGVACDT
jgi:resuscitation-promoting factor RpfB